MNIKRNVYAAAAGLMAAYMAAATASAQNFMEYQYGATGGSVADVSVANLMPNWVVTGVTEGDADSSDQTLTTWESTGHALVKRGVGHGPLLDNWGMVTVVLTPNLVVTGGMRQGSLRLTSWSISSTGAVTLGKTTLADEVQGLAMTRLDSGRVVVAALNNVGQLNISVWAVTPSSISLEGQINGIACNDLAIAALSSSQIVTAVQTASGDLQLESWSVNDAGALTYLEDNSAGGIKQVSITAWEAGHVATAVINSLNDLEVIDWDVNPNTGVITRVSSANVGAVSEVAVSTIGPLIFTASVNSSGNVDAGVWGYSGPQLTAGDSAQREAAKGVLAVSLNPAGLQSVTASANSAGNLQLDVWSGDYVP